MNRSVKCFRVLPLLALVSPVFSNILHPTQEEADFLRWLRDPESMQMLQGALRAGAELSRQRAPPVQDLKCIEDLTYALSSTDTLQMVDSFDKAPVPTGILAGSFTHLGNWEECVGVRDVFSPSTKRTFHGQMCIVNISPNITRTILPLGTEVEMGMLADVLLRIAFCVPSTCTAKQIEGFFHAAIPNSYSSPVIVNVNDVDCTTADKRPLDGHAWAGISVCIVLGIIVVASTAYDVVMPSTRKQPLPAAFSVVSNGRKLLAAPRAGGDQTLSSLHGIRFLSMIWVVVGHRYMYSMMSPSLNPKFIYDVFDKWYYIGLTNATVSVDTFFVLSGLLVTYLFFKQEPSKRHLNVPMYYIHRYIRLTPALAMMVLVHASFLNRVGSGPLWPASIAEERDACRKNWWNTLLYVSNYVDTKLQCVGQSWYLMVDMQLHWISPLLIIPLAKWPRLGRVFFLPFIIAGLIISFVISYVNEFPSNMMAVNDEETVMKFFGDYYIVTYTRFVPYIIGMAFGYILAEERERRERKKLTRVVGFFGWLSATALLLVSLFMGFPFVKAPLPSNLESAFYNALHRPAWSLGVAGVVYLCANGLGGPVNKLLSWQGFQILGRFSYCIYLVHITIQIVHMGGIMTSEHLSNREVLMQFSADFVTALFLAAALSLVCESPFLVLEKQLLGGHRNPKEAAPRTQTLPSAPHLQESKSPERIV